MKHVQIMPLHKAGAHDKSINYIGAWEYDGKRRYTAGIFKKCIFTFYGPEVKVYVFAGPSGGICEIWLDGEYLASTDCYAEERTEVCVFEKCGLTGAAPHNLLVLVTGEKNKKSSGITLEIAGFAAPVPVDYFAELKRRCDTEYAAIRGSLKTWKESGAWKPVTGEAEMPNRGVVLLPGLVRRVYDLNIENIKYDAGIPDYCEGPPPDHIGGKDKSRPGWSGWLPASNEGRMLGGAAGALRWEEDPELRHIVDRIIGDIKGRMRDDGYYNYYPENESYDLAFSMDEWTDRSVFPGHAGIFSERKNYDRVFWARGMLAAIQAGNPEAPELLRRMCDWFNQQRKYLTTMLLGGNSTNGIPGGPLVYQSEVGKPDDLIITQRYFDQDYWMETLAERQPLAFTAYPGERPHCYTLLSIEAIADEYMATGDEKYYRALMGAWDIYHRYYKHVGGPTAICEIDGPYPPGSYLISTGHNGETCGHVFWGWINRRLMQLYPREEKYIAQVEELIYNTLINCRNEKGHTRYHIRLHGKKNPAENVNSCCQVSSTIAISSIPQYIYLINGFGIFVNLFIPSRYDSEFGTLTMETDFPNSGSVSITVDPVRDGERFDVNLRIPEWALKDVTVLVNGGIAGTGRSGERLCLNRAWKGGDRISFTIPFGLRLFRYTGTDQSPDNRPRYTMLYGPILMALNAPECKDGGTIPRIGMDTGELIRRLQPAKDKPLHFPVPGTAYTFMPYWDAGEEGFTCVPVIEA
jgi:DUF1680 family protein